MKLAGILLLQAALLVLLIKDVDAVQCWRCSSDSSTSAFCDDPFDSSIINDEQRRWAFVDCSLPSRTQYQPFGGNMQSTRPICKKMKQTINDHVIISRSCSYEDVNTLPDSCMQTKTPSYIKTEFCRTCDSDGCNHGVSLRVGVVLIFLSVLLTSKDF